MFKAELTRAFQNKFLVIALVLGIILGSVGLFSYYQDSLWSVKTGDVEAVSAYSAFLYALSLGTGAIFRLVAPLLATLPFFDINLFE